HALMVIDRRTNRAVRLDVKTGVLPKDHELTMLRALVINRKRGATAAQHSRFFDRLGELVVDYVRTGDDNFELYGPVPLDWREYSAKLVIVPPNRADFTAYLLEQRVSPELAQSLVGLGVLDADRDRELLQQVAAARDGAPLPDVKIGGLDD